MKKSIYDLEVGTYNGCIVAIEKIENDMTTIIYVHGRRTETVPTSEVHLQPTETADNTISI